MAGLGDWAEHRSGKAQPHIVVAHHSDGVKVTDHPTKAAAMEHGRALRKAGVLAYVHSAANAAKHGLDPRRDQQGRFA